MQEKKGRTSRPEINDSVVPPSPLQVLLFSFEDFVGSAAALLLATIFQTEAELKKVKCESQPVKFGKNNLINQQSRKKKCSPQTHLAPT